MLPIAIHIPSFVAGVQLGAAPETSQLIVLATLDTPSPTDLNLLPMSLATLCILATICKVLVWPEERRSCYSDCTI